MDKHSPIAIVGMAGVFPGASDLETYWQNIVHKVDTTAQVPDSRWAVDTDAVIAPIAQPDKAFHSRACLINDFQFDPEGLNLDPGIVDQLDPMHQLALHVGREALSGIQTHNGSGRILKETTGVILAAIALPTDRASAFSKLVFGPAIEKSLPPAFPSAMQPPFGVTGQMGIGPRVTSFPAAILAKALGLGGGTYTLDAACASSLFSIKLACEELQSRRSDLMLAGGVSRPDSLYTQIGFSQLRALSPSGRCAPFDQSADGLIVGEGCGILVLKRLADAERDGNEILCVIRGIGLSNDIGGNLLAPDPEGQIRAMTHAYDMAGWSPADVDLVECHGAGTPVGDGVELESLKNLWDKTNASGYPCAIGSVKSMIGHLLTAAGAAGLIKVLLAIKNGMLPPTLHFKKAAANSPLTTSPFHVQAETAPWPRRRTDTPRRAAISAFGFGGINAHLLIEEYIERPTTTRFENVTEKEKNTVPIAVVGLSAAMGPLSDLKQFQKSVLGGTPAFVPRPSHRWKGVGPQAAKGVEKGAFISEVPIDIRRFHTPPNEIPDIIPQHLLMLNTAAEAMMDAGLTLRENRIKMGAIIGMGFDMEATNFHLRWTTPGTPDSISPPLTAARTLGALGSMVASRIAKEFRLGSPSFVVSCEEASGIKALDIAIRTLQRREADTMLIGAVDMAGDLRQILLSSKIRTYSPEETPRAFDQNADGTKPGEGAVALVLKRLDQARQDGDRIYAVINGIGGASGEKNLSVTAEKTYLRSYAKTLADAGYPPHGPSPLIDFYEVQGTGDPIEDGMEAALLNAVLKQTPSRAALGALPPIIGHTGAASGLCSVLKTCLCLYQEIIPPIGTFPRPPRGLLDESRIFLPAYPQYWARNKKDGPRVACVAMMTNDGNATHVLLSNPPNEISPTVSISERNRPLGFKPFGLFTMEGDSQDDIISGLAQLERWLALTPSRRAPMESLAWDRYKNKGAPLEKKLAVALVADTVSNLEKYILKAKDAVVSGKSLSPGRFGGVAYSPDPMGTQGQIALVFPGSGNHYLGMGREIGVQWPEILRAMDEKTDRLKDQMLPHIYVPQRCHWENGWESAALDALAEDPLHMIFGQVIYGGMMSDLIRKFNIHPDAVIGYSLGETAGNFAVGLWSDRGDMLERMQETDLFSTQLAGPCIAGRRAWHIADTKPFDWVAAVVNRPADIVRKALADFPHARLLIVNTPDECVIGGLSSDIRAVINALSCDGVYIEGVITVHCDAVNPVADAYRQLHHFPVSPPENIRFYSCANARRYAPTSERSAQSILDQARHGFDFPKTIQTAYQDGIRIFLEVGPHNSCSRMIQRILHDKDHISVSASNRGEDEHLGILKFLAVLISQRVPVNLSFLYGKNAFGPHRRQNPSETATIIKSRPVGDVMQLPAPEAKPARKPTPVHGSPDIPSISPYSAVITRFEEQVAATAQAHTQFLDLSDELTQSYAQTYAFQMQLLKALGDKTIGAGYYQLDSLHKHPVENAPASVDHPDASVAFSRQMCMEFAVGSVEKVLGPMFAPVDTYPARVRLPDEPLMLVDRIVSIEGEKGSLGSGKIITEHDVLPEAWYLDGNRAPVCISVEAGQADLFLCAYLGIDLKVKGKRTYRLLDATVDFFRQLPRPGDTIRYHIEIERFARQGETYLFFFQFDGFIGEERLIRMRNGCAGFFTSEEVKNSGGIIFPESEREPVPGVLPKDWTWPVPMQIESYDKAAVNALRAGNLERCFGDNFKGKSIPTSLRLPGGKMTLIDRIVHLDPTGGRYGLGRIQGEADIQPDKWFLTCHFVDDMVMPGTLMYECCAHTLRVFVQRMGWISDKSTARYEPVIGVRSLLKCRGPVTPATKKVVYELEVKELGYGPEPFVIADAHMYADGQRIVWFRDMTLKLSSVSRSDIEALWPDEANNDSPRPVVFDKKKVRAFSEGNPSEAFGAPYRPFDHNRFIARLPREPYSFISRVTQTDPPPWDLRPGGWITAEYDVPVDAWFFQANRTPTLPVSILLEIALQPCGWLAAYAGSALKSDKDLRFRNLGGTATLFRDVTPGGHTVTTRSRMTKVSAAGEMIIEHFDFEVSHAGKVFYRGNTNFGFFTETSLDQQVGLGNIDTKLDAYSGDALNHIPVLPPLTPNDTVAHSVSTPQVLEMPGKAILMIDQIDRYEPTGGPAGLGYVRGQKTIDPKEWFFTAHFFQDPVCPGSLGIESFIQLLRFFALKKWPNLIRTHRVTLSAPSTHEWIYRGQVRPKNNKVTVAATITDIQEGPTPAVTANGYLWVDGLAIYKMENFGISLVDKNETT